MWAWLKVVLISLTALSNFLLGLLVLARNPKNRINKTFFLMSLLFTTWALCLLFYEFPIVLTSLFWIRATYFVVSFLVISILVFSFIFPTLVLRRAWSIAAAFSVLFLIFTTWLLYFTRSWVLGVIIHPVKGLQMLWGPGYVYWTFITWLFFIWALINLIYKNRRASGLEKLQLRYVFYGFALWGIGLNIPDVVIPFLFNDTRYFSISPLANLFFSLAIAYTILKHRLMDIRLVVARSVAYTLLILTLAIFYAGGLFLVGTFITGVTTTSSSLITSTALALVIAFSFQPLRRYFERTTDEVLYKDHYHTDELLHLLSQTMASTINLQTLAGKCLSILRRQMRLSWTAFVILDKEKLQVIAGDQEINLHQFTRDSLDKFKRKKRILVFEELEEGEPKELLRQNDISVLAPLRTEKRLIGFLLLGVKSSGDIYFEQDLRVLGILGPEFAVALQNAQRFEEIKQFTVTLQQKVKKATVRFRHANERLKELDRLKDEFMSVAAHQLRTPLGSMRWNIETLLWEKSRQVSKPVKEIVQQVYESNLRMITLINDLLNISRIEQGRVRDEPKLTNILKIVKEAIQELEAVADEKSVSLDLQVKKDHFTKIMIDPKRFREVIGNLLSNAVKYNREKGKVTVKVEQADDHIELSVADTGIGIPKKQLDRVFTKFFRADNAAETEEQGTGMGLFLVKLYVESWGGQVDFESAEGEGTTFTITLPVKPGQHVLDKNLAKKPHQLAD